MVVLKVQSKTDSVHELDEFIGIIELKHFGESNDTTPVPSPVATTR